MISTLKEQLAIDTNGVNIVKIISNEILKRDKIPYYGTAWSNIASKRLAINAGYKPVWVEMKAMRSC